MKRVLAMLMVLALLVANVPPVAVEAVAEDWENVYLVDISVKTLPDKTEYFIGEPLKTNGLTLTAIYSDGSTKDITEGFDVNWDFFDPWMSGTQTVYVNYEGMITFFDVTVVSMTGISVKTLPDKTEYWMGEELDTTGLTLTLNYSNGTTKDVTEGFYVGWFDPWMYGTQSVCIEYEGYSTSFDVTVIGVTGLSVKTLPEKTEYFRGEYIDTKGLTLTVSYSNGTTKDITDGFYIDWFDSYMTGVQTVNVSYEGRMTSFEVTVINGGYCGDNLQWKLDEYTGELTISGIGAMSDWSSPWNEWSHSITSVVIEEGVTNIGANAFVGCYYLSTVSIPESVTYIGTGAFDGCSSLTNITIPANVSYIGDGAFRYCSSLSGVTITNGVTSIGSEAFHSCEQLAQITIPNSVTYIGSRAFANCSSLVVIDLPDRLDYIGEEVFYNCYNLTGITLSEGISEIGYHAFYGCTGLLRIAIPASVTRIGGNAFGNCDNLTEVYYLGYEEYKPNMMIEDGNDALVNANWIYESGAVRTGIVVYTPPYKTTYWVNEEPDITGLVIGVQYSNNFLISITEGFAVSGFDTSTAGTKVITVTYKGLTTTFNVTVKDKSGVCGRNVTWALGEDGVLTISGNGDMYDYQYGLPDWYELRAYVTAIVIEDGVTGLGDYAFCYTSNATEVSIADSVTTIGQGAFESCSSLAEVSIPSGVTGLENYVFYNCGALQNITLPVGVTSIGDRAFYNCSSLSTVNYQGNQKQKAQIVVGEGNDSIMQASWNYSTQNIVLTDIVIKVLPEKTKYMIGESLDTKGLVLTATYSDGSTVDVTSGFTLMGFDPWATGDQMVTLVYEDFRTSFEVTVTRSGTCDGLTWALDDNGVLTISGNGMIYDHNNPWSNWNYDIYSVVIEEGVTQIGSYAFADCHNLSTITIPESVTYIGFSAFESCWNLYTVNYNGTRDQKSRIYIEEYNEPITNATWSCAKVAEYEKDGMQTQCESLEEALAAGGTVRLLRDIKVSTVAVKPGTTLDLNGYTLTADLVVAMKGAVIRDGGAACTGGGLLKISQSALVYAPSEGLQIIPVWNGVDGYIFTKVTIQQLTQPTADESTARYMFLPSFSNREAAALLSDGGIDNGLKFQVCMTWNGGKSQLFYTYEDSLVSMVYDGTGRLAFDLSITGIAGITDIVLNAQVATDTGAIAASAGIGK